MWCQVCSLESSVRNKAWDCCVKSEVVCELCSVRSAQAAWVWSSMAIVQKCWFLLRPAPTPSAPRALRAAPRRTLEATLSDATGRHPADARRCWAGRLRHASILSPVTSRDCLYKRPAAQRPPKCCQANFAQLTLPFDDLSTFPNRIYMLLYSLCPMKQKQVKRLQKLHQDWLESYSKWILDYILNTWC